MTDTLILIITVISILFAIGLLLVMAKINPKGERNRKGSLVAILSIVFILSGISFGLATKSDPVPAKQIILVDSLILVTYMAVLALTVKLHQRSKNPKLLSTRKIAFLGILIGLSSALMLLGFPIMPMAPYLKVELSGLIIFMTLLWFDWKTAAVVSLFTNFIHVFLPGSAPLILFLDEGVNFIATMVFIFPMACFINRVKLESNPNRSAIIIISVVGVIFTAIVMTLYNAFINLPLVYGMQMPFWTVVELFGVFNLIKWGFVALAINLTWKRLYSLRNFGEEDPDVL